jgi:hypothetical protein
MYKDLKFDYKPKMVDKKFGPYEKGGKFRSINTKAMLDNLKRSMNVYGEAGSPLNNKETN